MLEAPVGVGGARAGRASIICGGDAELFARIKPLFKCFATRIHHVGPVDNASIVKSIDILIAGANLAVACEGFHLGARAGIDPDPGDSRADREDGDADAVWLAVARAVRGCDGEGLGRGGLGVRNEGDGAGYGD